MAALFIGLMSGTSLDGVDGALVDFDAPGELGLRVLAHVHHPFDDTLAAELLALNQAGENELHRAALAANTLARLNAKVVADLLEGGVVAPDQVHAIGAHGQTVRHRPAEFDGTGYTLQINAPALLAELSGISVVADLRSRDVAAGGQGAPLVPAFHQAVFSQADKTVAVLNIGGISNLSVLAPGETPLGMDCGPGNVLLDLWCRQHLGQPFDRGGAWSAGGKVHGALLRSMRSDPYFARALPKSTGRDHFHAAWLAEHLNACGLGSGLDAEAARSVQATLAALTAQCVADELTRHGPLAQRLWACGGGAFNADLLNRLQQALPNVQVASTQGAGMAPDQVEACAFAWLARQYVLGRPGNVPGVTGAQGWRRLGALYPGL